MVQPELRFKLEDYVETVFNQTGPQDFRNTDVQVNHPQKNVTRNHQKSEFFHDLDLI